MDNTVAEPATGAHHEILLRSTSAVDVHEAAQYVYGYLARLAAPVLRRYWSDLYRDAMWIDKYVRGEEFTFWWSVDSSGTGIGTDDVALYRTLGFRVTVTCTPGRRIALSVEQVQR